MAYPNPYESPRTLASACTDQTLFARAISFGIDRTWRIDGPGQSHTIRLRHSYWIGHAVIEIDDNVIYYRSTKLVDWGLTHTFILDGVTFAVKVSPCLLRFRYELFVDDSLRATDG